MSQTPETGFRDEAHMVFFFFFFFFFLLLLFFFSINKFSYGSAKMSFFLFETKCALFKVLFFPGLLLL